MAPQQPSPAITTSAPPAAPPVSSAPPAPGSSSQPSAHPTARPAATQGQVHSQIQQHVKEFPIAPTLVLVFFLVFMATMLGFVVQKHQHRRKLLGAAQNQWPDAQAAGGAPAGAQDLRILGQDEDARAAAAAADEKGEREARRRSYFGCGWLTSLLGRGHIDSNGQETGDAVPRRGAPAPPTSMSTVAVHSSDLEKVEYYAGGFSQAGTSAAAGGLRTPPSIRRKSSLMRAASKLKAKTFSKRPHLDFLTPVPEKPEPALLSANASHTSLRNGIYASSSQGPSSQMTLVSVYDSKKPSRDSTPVLPDLDLDAPVADTSYPPSAPQDPGLSGSSLAPSATHPALSTATLVAPPGEGPRHSVSAPSMATRDQAYAMVKENRHSNSGFF